MNTYEIAGVTYKVLWQDVPIVDGGVEQWAVLDSENRELKVFSGLSEKDLRHIFIHEASHEILNLLALSIENEEYLIKVFIRLLVDTIERNRLYMRKLKP